VIRRSAADCREVVGNSRATHEERTWILGSGKNSRWRFDCPLRYEGAGISAWPLVAHILERGVAADAPAGTITRKIMQRETQPLAHLLGLVQTVNLGCARCTRLVVHGGALHPVDPGRRHLCAGQGVRAQQRFEGVVRADAPAEPIAVEVVQRIAQRVRAQAPGRADVVEAVAAQRCACVGHAGPSHNVDDRCRGERRALAVQSARLCPIAFLRQCQGIH